jgi:hypothetical protein
VITAHPGQLARRTRAPYALGTPPHDATRRPSYLPRDEPRRRWPWFAAALITLLLGAFVLDGPAAALAELASIALFGLACVLALRGKDTRAAERTGMFLGG